MSAVNKSETTPHNRSDVNLQHAQMPARERFLAGAQKPRAYYVEKWINEQYKKTASGIGSKAVDYYSPSTLKLYSKDLHRFVDFVYKHFIKDENNLAKFETDELRQIEINRSLNKLITEQPDKCRDAYFKWLAESGCNSIVSHRSVLRIFYKSLFEQGLVEFPPHERETNFRGKGFPEGALFKNWLHSIKENQTRYNTSSERMRQCISDVYRYLYFIANFSEKDRVPSSKTITRNKDWPEDIVSRVVNKPGKNLQEFFDHLSEKQSVGNVIAIRSNIRLFYIWVKEKGYSEFSFKDWEKPAFGHKLPKTPEFQNWLRKLESRINKPGKTYNSRGISEDSAKNYVRLMERFIGLVKDVANLPESVNSDELTARILKLPLSDIHTIIQRMADSSGIRITANLKVVLNDFYKLQGRKLDFYS